LLSKFVISGTRTQRSPGLTPVIQSRQQKDSSPALCRALLFVATPARTLLFDNLIRRNNRAFSVLRIPLLTPVCCGLYPQNHGRILGIR
jgi:hypothetical protein